MQIVFVVLVDALSLAFEAVIQVMTQLVVEMEFAEGMD